MSEQSDDKVVQYESGEIDEDRMNSLYEGVFEALAPNLILQFNTSTPGSMTTEEMVVVSGWDGEELTLRAQDSQHYKLKDGAEGVGLYASKSGHFIDHYVDVVTIEVVGVGS